VQLGLAGLAFSAVAAVAKIPSTAPLRGVIGDAD
jgi:hypothetical protein